jgi:glutaminase
MDNERRKQVEERLDELYGRHAEEPTDGIAGVYQTGRGLIDPSEAGEELDQFGICLVGVEGEVFAVGDFERPFPLHSISKVFTYGLALEDHGRDRVLERVGVKPSGDAFNALEFDEPNNRPHNPMVNAGALAATDLVKGDDLAQRSDRIVDAQRRYAANHDLTVDEEAYELELGTADRNRATGYLMRSEGMLEGEVEDTVDLYLRQCSVGVTCRDLAAMGATLANGCVNPLSGERALRRERVRDVLTVMYTCGMYDFAGEWAYDVGVPAKSGVSGGIMAVIPGKMGIGVFSPGLDRYGNSVRGTRVCAEVSNRLGLHLFATDAEDSLLGRASGDDASR